MTTAQFGKRSIYLDNHATTPVDPRVLQAMLPYFSEKFGNAMSGSHHFGWEAAMAVEQARASVAHALNADVGEIVFTAGATESAHLAILGGLEEFGRPAHIITAATEHKCILEISKRAERLGHSITVLPVDEFGSINLVELQTALRPDTFMVSLMHGNNEIGTLHPLAKIGAICNAAKVLFHVDAAQTVGKHPLDVRAMNIDLLSLSGHKLYAPKGVGALFVRQTPPRVHLAPYLVGGGQEKGLRGGTHNVPGIVGLGAACEVAMRLMPEESARLTRLRDHMISRLTTELKNVSLNGHPQERLCNNVNVTIDDVASDRILLALYDVAFSSGSACSFGSGDVSHVLKAIGKTSQRPATTLRFGLGRWTTPAEIDAVCDRLISCVTSLKEEPT